MDDTEGHTDDGRRLAGRWRSLAPALGRLGEARALLAAVAAVDMAFVLFGGLTVLEAVLGLLAVALVALMLPTQERHPPVTHMPASGRPPLAAAQPAPAAHTRTWRALAAALPAPAVLLDRNSRVLLANAGALELMGRTAPGQHVSLFVRHPEFLDALDRARTASGPVAVQVTQRVPVERRIAVMLTRIEPRPATDDLPAMIVSFSDLTESEQVSRMRADFIANVSHELRTPVASLKGYIETLQGAAENDPAARKRFLAIMAQQAERMTRLIDDLLQLTRVEMQAHVPPRGTADLNEILAHVADALDPIAHEAGITIEIRVLEGGAVVRGDRDQLVQVFQNLMQNAVKYGLQGGHVRVLVARLGDRMAVDVADDGPGIAPEHLPRLTERFYRVDAGESRAKGGTGLGLAIVKHVLARHRGELKIRSEVGKGSTFTVLLPAA